MPAYPLCHKSPVLGVLIIQVGDRVVLPEIQRLLLLTRTRPGLPDLGQHVGFQHLQQQRPPLTASRPHSHELDVLTAEILHPIFQTSNFPQRLGELGRRVVAVELAELGRRKRILQLDWALGHG